MIGTQIGDLELLQLLGEGGMGSVYLARHRLLGTLRAVKVLHLEQLAERFVTEGRASATLAHPHLVAVHDLGRIPDGPWYMVMEYLEGGTLAAFIAVHGPVSPHLILQLLAGVMACLQYIHEHGVVHRDLKPDNLFLVQGGDPHFVKVLDLGIAQVRGKLATNPGTQLGTVMGTPEYMSPEQHRGLAVAPSSDVYSLAMVIYQMVTGGYSPWQELQETAAGFRELSPPEIYHRLCSMAPIDPRRRVSGLSEGWVRALMRALDADPGTRVQTMRELALLLAESTDGGLSILQHSAGVLLRQPPSLATIQGKRFTPSHSTLGAAAAQVSSVPRRVGFGVAAILLLVLLGVVTLRGRSAPLPVPAPPDAQAQTPDAQVSASVDAFILDAHMSADAASVPDAGPRRARAIVAAPLPPQTGTLIIIVQPWAIIHLKGKSLGQTPYRGELPVGRYEVHLENEDAHRADVVPVLIRPGQTTMIERSW